MLFYLKAILEIIIISFFYYVVLLFIRGTRAENVAKGLLILIISFFLFNLLKLYTLEWILSMIWPIAIISFVVIFHPELRSGLAKLGRRPFTTTVSEEDKIIRILTRTATSLSSQKIGALIVIEREIGLGDYINNGVILDCEPSRELLLSIFNPTSPLHDGAIIISGKILRSAGSILPLSDRTTILKTLGTRHRAAIGVTEESDALVIVVSEETGTISVAETGKLIREVGEERLTEMLKQTYIAPATRLSLHFKGKTKHV
jgi:diadenylate cyclase